MDGRLDGFRIRCVPWTTHGAAITELRRAAHAAISEDADDALATHFVAADAAGIVAAVRVTFAERIAIDFEPILPLPLPPQARGEFVSAGRFAVAAHARQRLVALLRALIRTSWLHAWPLGARIALVTAPPRLVPVYQRVIGTVPLGPPDIHPCTHRRVQLMAYRPRAGGRGVIDDLVHQLPGAPISAAALAYLSTLEAMHAQPAD